jgi:hypothetical protein
VTEDYQKKIGELTKEQLAGLTCAQIGALMAAHSFSIYAVVAALAEQGLVRPDRVVAWAESFADMFDQNPSHPENKDAAAHLRNFAGNLVSLNTLPSNAGRA